MANQVTIKQSPAVKGTFKASAFNKDGTPVLDGWQEFNVAGNMVWDPGKYGAPITEFYIAKGIGPDKDNQFVAYAVKVEFNREVQNAVLTLGIGTVDGCDGAADCNVFIAEAKGVTVSIVTNGVPVAETELPQRCQC